MTLEQLRIFVAVAERAHLTRAAEALHLSPSAVSAAIRALEERYGQKLFNRVGRGIEPSAAGAAFLPAARAALAAAAAAEQALSEGAALVTGRLALQASQTVAAYWVPEHLMRLQTAHPGVGVSLAIGNTASVADAVAEGAADLGFIEGAIDAPALGSRQVAVDRLVIVTAPDHPWADGRRRQPYEIAEGRWILRERGSGTRSAFEASLVADGIAPAELEVMLTLPSNEAIVTALGNSSCAGVMSERVAETALAAGRLARIDYPVRPRAFRMLWHKQRHFSRAAQAFDALLPRQIA